MFKFIRNLKNKFVHKTTETGLKEYVNDALRTESKPEKLALNEEIVVDLFRMYIELGEILDGVKKSVFYNKDSKLVDEFEERILTIYRLADDLHMKRGNITHKKDTQMDPRVFHGILGIMTESSELAEIWHTHATTGATIDPVHVQEELGDGMALGWYPAILHDALNLNPKETLDKNIRKLKVRFPEKYSDQKAANRNLVLERKELES
jgi:hypothetical protein